RDSQIVIRKGNQAKIGKEHRLTAHGVRYGVSPHSIDGVMILDGAMSTSEAAIFRSRNPEAELRRPRLVDILREELAAAFRRAEEQMEAAMAEEAEAEAAAEASADEYVIRTRGASKSGISKLERVEISGGGWRVDDCCTICLEEMGSGESRDGGGMRVIKLECRHVFHESCLVSWIRTSNGCPLCRFQIPD
ncbi:E3 ubiquitin-protein ligase RING1-like, partial [Linum perenne]